VGGRSQLVLLDMPSRAELNAYARTREEQADGQLLVYSAAGAPAGPGQLVYVLSAWTGDDLIEYLLLANKERIGSVLARLSEADKRLCDGNPELLRVVLDELAAYDALPSGRAALLRKLYALLPEGSARVLAREVCLNSLRVPAGMDISSLLSPLTKLKRWLKRALRVRTENQLTELGFSAPVMRLLRHVPVQRELAAQKIVGDLECGSPCLFLASQLRRDLVDASAEQAACSARAIERLHELVAMPGPAQPMVASLLHAAASDWKPEGAVLLRGAYLAGVHWPRAQLEGAILTKADLSGSDLRCTNLRGAIAKGTSLTGSFLQEADLSDMNAFEADLSHTDLFSATGTGAKLDGANLEEASLEAAKLANASFVGANLKGAHFQSADLCHVNFRKATIKDADFTQANLSNALLDGLVLREAIFDEARFARAALSDCDLEGMNLANADFTKARHEPCERRFHQGEAARRPSDGDGHAQRKLPARRSARHRAG
jgi:uncharacterized protein YjbI with pentapeptide repeats